MRIILLIALSLLPGAYAYAQVGVKQQMDTIVLISGRKVPAQVQRVSPNQVTFIPLNETAARDINRRQVHQIIYRTGRIETLNSMAATLIEEGDWQTVILTEEASDVEGLYTLGKIEARSSPQSRSARAAQRSADIRLKKRAANMGGIMIFIIRRESTGGYGEIPTHFVEGEVYGYEQPVLP